jgi:hypothetical protein
MSFLSGRTSLTTVQTADLADNSVTLAKFAHGTASQNIAYDGSGVPVDVASTSGASAAEATNIMLNAFRISVNGGLTKQNMVDGVVDEFEDETGVDTSTSTNETYDATNDLYKNPGVFSLIDRTLGTAIGSMTSGGGVAAGFDGVTDQNNDAGATQFDTVTSYIGKDWGSGNDKVVTGFKMWGSNNVGFIDSANPTLTMVLQGSTDNFVSSSVDLTSNTVVDTASSPTVEKYDGTITASYRYHRMSMTNASGSSHQRVSECQFFDGGTAANMTLVPNATTALAVPTDANIVIWQQDVTAITLNTDLKAYASRNGGSTYGQITLAEVANLTTGRVLTGTVDISAQSSATDMKYKIETLNAKEQKIHAVALQWS